MAVRVVDSSSGRRSQRRIRREGADERKGANSVLRLRDEENGRDTRSGTPCRSGKVKNEACRDL